MSKEAILEKLRADADKILRACLDAADPAEAVKRFVSLQEDNRLVCPDFQIQLNDVDRIVLVGAGKGSAPMAKAIEDLLDDRLAGGAICVKYGHGIPLKKVEVIEAGHPVPDEAGREAVSKIIGILESAGPKDLVISCISGGGSALMPAPAAGISLGDKQEITQQLLAVGANIYEINAVRKHLSDAKGGNLMRRAYPAFVINLMLSDVIGEDPGTIASGPFAPDSSTFQDALDILDRYGLKSKAPTAIAARIRNGAAGKVPETPKHGDPIFSKVRNIVVGSNILSLYAGRSKAEELGYKALILSSSIQGDTTEAALFHWALAKEVRTTGNPIRPPACLLSGGETTVVLKGNGRGGRNQEFALSLVRKAAEVPRALFVSAATDGTDGPTDAAGAVVDSLSLERAVEAGLNPDAFLKNNDSYTFFEKLGDLIITGPTRTNVMDVRIVLVAEFPPIA